MSGYFIGLDGGGTKTVAWLTDRQGNVLGRGKGGTSNFTEVGIEHAKKVLHQVMVDAFADAGIHPCKLDGLGLGLAGMDREDDQEWVREWVLGEDLAKRFKVCNDCELLLWAGTPYGWGIGLIAGTGSIAVGKAADGRMGVAGGWGYLIGDEGSGYAIGQAALHAVTQAVDGRAPKTLLVEKVLEFWNLKTAKDLLPQVYGGQSWKPEIAQLSKPVVEAADEGDAVAQAILNQAAVDLAKTVCAVARQLDFSGQVPLALGGGVVVNNDKLAESVIAQIHAMGIDVSPITKVSEPVTGAVRMALSLD